MSAIQTIIKNRKELGKVLNFQDTDNELVVQNAKQAHKDLKTLIEIIKRYEMMYENTGAIFNRMNMKRQIEELTSLNLWSARRLAHQQHKDFAYDELDKITGKKHERV